MNNEIRKSDIVNKDLSCEEFFKELINTCSENNFIGDKKIEKILYRRIELLKEKLRYYTGSESSSVTEEEAESILIGVDYTIGLYLKSLTIEEGINELRNEDLGELLRHGESLIKDKLEQNKVLFNHIKKNKLNVNNYSYDDTVEYGLSVFFPKYDIFFKPQETPCSIDYQLPVDIMYYSGIEYIEKYLKIMSFENKFCNGFKTENIIRLLKNYDDKYEELLINIFELVLINAIGNVICHKDMQNLILNENDIEQIQYELKDLSKDEILNKFSQSLKKCLDILNICNDELFSYGMTIIKKEEEYLYRNVKEESLKNVFIVLRKVEKDKIIEYVDGEKLVNSKFRKYTEEIRACEKCADKIKIINSKFKSLEDIVDMLEAECLFDEEYNVYFKSMEKIQVILLWKVLKEKYSESNKEWCGKYVEYILTLGKEEQDFVEKISRKVKFII